MARNCVYPLGSDARPVSNGDILQCGCRLSELLKFRATILEKRATGREKILSWQVAQALAGVHAAGRHADDSAMDVFRTAGAYALAYAGLRFEVRVYPHLPDLGNGCFPAKVSSCP
jgi:hypothetical protein